MSTIIVDNRDGSDELAPLLKARGLPVLLGRLPYGDVSWLGSGPDGEPVTVGVEVKKVRDVLQCMTNGRFAGHQLPGMMQSYSQPWLLMVGVVRACLGNGLLQLRGGGSGGWQDATVGTRRFMYKDLQTWLLTIAVKGGIRVQCCTDWNEAILWLSALYGWWTVKGWEGHHAHLALNVSGSDDRFRDRAMLVQPSMVQRVAAQLPGVGWDKSRALAAKYDTVSDLLAASKKELATVPGIGPGIAEKVWNALRRRG